MPKQGPVEARIMYVEGITGADGAVTWPSMLDIARHFGLNDAALRKRASRENWTEARALFRRRLEAERQERRIDEIATLGADLDLQALRVARNGLNVTEERLAELTEVASIRGQALRNGNPLPGVPIESIEIERLSRAANDWYAMGLRAIGDTQRVRIEVEEIEPADASARDARALGILAIMQDHNLLPPEMEDVIDVSAGRLSLVAGDGQGEDQQPPAPEGERVHPEVAHDRQPQPEAESVPPAP